MRVVVPTFAEAAERVHADVATYAFQHLGERQVNTLATPHVLRVLSPIWLSKPNRSA